MGDTFSEEVSKRIQKAAEKPKDLPSVEKRVEEDRKDKSQAPFDKTTEGVLQEDDRANRQGNDDAHNLTEKNLREGEPKGNSKMQGTTEQRLNEASTAPYPHRNPEAHERTGEKRPVNALDEEMGKSGDDSERKRYEEASSKAQSEPKRILDKDVGKQLTLEHPKKSFNMKKAKLGEMTSACLGYLEYKGSEGKGWDKFAAVRGIDTELGAVMSAAESRQLTNAEMTRIGELKERKAGLLGVRFASNDGLRLAKNERRALSNAINEATKSQYWDDLWAPFTAISEAISPMGLTIMDAMLTGSDTAGGKGGKIFDLAKEGKPIANAALHVGWYKMPESGRWEVVAYLT
jgi:hypothetical protein